MATKQTDYRGKSPAVQPDTSPSIKPSHKGRLHKALGIPEGEPIPLSSLVKAKNSTNPHMRQMANYAINAKGFNHPSKKQSY